jgi:hypothetical protein
MHDTFDTKVCTLLKDVQAHMVAYFATAISYNCKDIYENVPNRTAEDIMTKI